MILGALHDYYNRLRDSGDTEIAPPGWIRKPIDYVVYLTSDGQPYRLESRFELLNGKRKSGRAELLPSIGKQAQKHTNSGEDANLLWDNAGFALGYGKDGQKKLRSFVSAIESWFPEPGSGLNALRTFLQLHLDGKSGLGNIITPLEAEALASGSPIVTFALVEDAGLLLCQRPDVLRAYELAGLGTGVGPIGICLLTGVEGLPIQTNETVIKGVWGAQSSGANIISFNKPAFESYGKTGRGGENAPVSTSASFAYTTALNFLLREGSRSRAQIGDSTSVFWAARQTDLESAIPDLFGEPPKDDPDRGVTAVKALYSAIDSGRLAGAEGSTRFFVLGLSPNAARVAIRFFHCLPLCELACRIRQHFDDLKVARAPHDAPYLSIFRLLVACAAQGKADNIPPNLGGSVVDAILAGPNTVYPAQLLNVAVNRCRAERAVNYPRAAVLKACLNRLIRQRSHEEEFKEMLDPNNTNAAYRLGRLFAVLEKIQEEAAGGHGKLNSTIRDRYYGAASSAPASVVPLLLKLKNHHIGKLDNRGKAMLYRAFQDSRPDDYIGTIIWGLKDIPSHLNLQEQGRFALGYYHQRQAFFTKTESNEPAQGAKL